MTDVTDDGHGQRFAAAFVLQDGQRIEQALGRVRHMRLTGRQHADRRAHMAGHQRRHAGLGIADDEHVDVQRFEREHGVEHALAFDARGQLHFQVDDIGAQAFGRQLEGHTRAGRRFGEQVSHRQPGEHVRARGQFAAPPHIVLRALEYRFEFIAAEVLQRQQVAQAAVITSLLGHGVSAGS